MADDAAELAARLAEQADAFARLLAAPGTDRDQVDESFVSLATTVSHLGDALRAVEQDGPVARALPPLEVTVPVLGVDACHAGWVGAILEPGAPRPRVAVAATIADLVETVRRSLDIVVVAVVVSSALPDELVEVDAWVRSRPTVLLLGAHPELSFAMMAGAPIVAGAKTDEGTAARLAALRAAGLAAPSVLNGSGYAAHDVLDACAAAWTAARRANGAAHQLPDPPQTHSDGIPAATWV